MYSNEDKIYITLVTGIFVLLVLVVFFVVTIVKYHRRKVVFNLEKLKAEFDQLDQERERIASDLHDDMGATLSSIKLRLQCIKIPDAATAAILGFSEDQLDKAVSRLRQIAFNMMPGILQRKGLNAGLTELIDLITDSTSIAINYQYKVDQVPGGKAIHIYRIVQEMLHNVVKHSKATLVTFTVITVKNQIELHLTDNGIGFDKKIFIKNAAGLGIRNIKARAELLKAKIYLVSLPGKGVDFLIKIPLS